ncbi:chondroitin sulfate synthase 1-like [Haliotis cracherodii]|uniref:chondroitin sulfate synthase 1-like n=1 Tax=Haliotis cracherodii TaxID=6455 RepID=UPI0039E965BB
MLPRGGSGYDSTKVHLQGESRRHIFAGVMTSRKFLKTRAKAIYETWGKDFPGELVFFIGTGEAFNTSLPVVVLKNVSDYAYPPQRKCFEMLRYMSGHHGHDFLWFMRLDDDVYLNTDLLKKFLTSINSSQHEYMGHPGVGTQKEKGHLGLDAKKPYCLGGPGVILSGPTLRQVAPHLPNCLKHPATPHEDTELGRCITNVTSLSCSNGKQFPYMFFQNYKDATGEWAVNLLPRYLHKMISFHPVKQPKYQFILHKKMLFSKLQTKLKDMDCLEKEKSFLHTFVKECNAIPCDDGGEVWTFINASYAYSMEPAHLKDSTLHRGRHLGLEAIQPALKPFFKEGNLRRSQIAYQKASALNGLEHVVVTRDRKKNYRLFRARQTFRPMCFRELPPKRT